jgi:hypothetical protein
MGTLNDWATVDANNNATPPDGWPENTMDYSDVNNTGRAVQGTLKRYFADINGSLDAGGIADVYTLSLNESGYGAYFDGMIFACTIPVTNLTTTPTLDVNGIGAASIVDRAGNALSIGELVSGGVYEFSHDGTNLRIAGSGGVAGLDTSIQFNNAGVFGGAVGLTYDTGSDELTVVNPVNITTDIILSDQADHTGTPGAGFGLIWLRDDGLLIYTNPSGVDVSIGTTGVSLPGGADTEMQYNNAGVFDGIASFTHNDGATTADQFSLTPLAGLTSGDLLNITANLSAKTGTVVNIIQDHASSVATALLIQQDGAVPHIDLTGANGTGIQIGGILQPIIPAQVANHIQAGNTQLVDGSQAISAFSISTDLAEGAYETIGPTGSGADNIWDTMDDIDADGTIAIFDIEYSATSSGTGNVTLRLDMATNGVTANPAASVVINDIHGGVSSAKHGAVTRIYAPLDGDYIFKLKWSVTGDSARSIVARYRGFITD